MSTDWGVIASSDLADAAEVLDNCVTMLRRLQAQGREVSVEELTLLIVFDDEDEGRGLKKAALVCATAIQKLAAAPE